MLRWFDLTHAVQLGFGTALWQRIALPRRGGIGDQDAWLMAALDALRHVKNADIAAEREERKDDTAAANELREFRREHGRNQ